jgi:CheY-like chemotaxis protein
MERRVLVAEDDSSIRSILAEYLRGEGFEVDVAADGAAALRIARGTRPDVVVVDAMMPVLDARGMLSAWMDDPVLKEIPVVLVSAAPGLSELAQQFGVRATLAKPFDLDVLGAIIEQVLAHPEPPPDAPTVPV